MGPSSSGRLTAFLPHRLFTSNPDLVNRIKNGHPLTPYNRPTFYGGDEKGYNDWPEYSD